MRIFHIQSTSITETQDLAALTAQGAPAHGFIWVACGRREFEVAQIHVQAMLQALCGQQLVDLHISDLINNQLPSHYDYTSQYDVLVFRRLAAGSGATEPATSGQQQAHLPARSGPPILRRIDTSPVGFAVFDRVLLTVHPTDCAVRDGYAAKLLQASSAESHAAGARLPSSPADLMLRVVNQMVDGFLELRRELTHQLDHWQSELLNPRNRFTNWSALLDARLTLHYLDEVCEDQRAALQDWIEAVKTWPDAETAAGQRERDLLQVRSRDVLEHIERVVHHVRRLEQSVETAVQMHFSVQGSRTNDIMRTLTVLTAVFLPLNLITGFFGMNFDGMPLIHKQTGVLWAVATMVLIAALLVVFFWRKRYLARTGR
ncbi:MAG: magnesium transporter CorA family protein [Rhodoferax sp.]